jgi:hypothetical protein
LETYCLAQGSTLSNGDLITLFHSKSWTDMRSKVLVSLLVSRVLGNKVEVFPSNDERSVHFGRDDGAGQNTAADGDKTGKWTLLICTHYMSARYIASKLCVPCAASRHS